jgi:DNA-directed RNA polymerase subunit RPC12/RpoP
MNNLSIYTKVFLIWYDLCLELLRCILAIQKAHKKNPGPIQYPCGICGRSVNSNHRAISCDNCEHWVHIKCGNISPVEYNNVACSRLVKSSLMAV